MFKLLKRYIKKYKGLIACNIVLVIFQIVLQVLFLAREMKNIIDKGVVSKSMDYIWMSGLKMMGFTLAAGLCTIAASYLSAKITAGLTCDIREACYKKVVKMSPQDFSNFGESTLLTRTVSDATQMQILVINFMRNSLMVPVIILVLCVAIFLMNKILFCILIAAFSLTIALLVIIGARSKPLFAELQKLQDRINLLVKEKITGVRTIRGFGNQQYEDEKMQKVNQDAHDVAILANNQINFLSPAAMIIMNWAVVLIYIVSNEQLKQSMASISDLLVIFQYLGYFVSALGVIPLLVNLLPKVVVSSARINELLEYSGENTLVGEKVFQSNGGEIEFKDVVFGYSNAVKTIANVSFTIEAGKTTAFIGATGSGKTTIMNLIMGFYQPVFGEVLVDGQSLREVNLDTYRSHVSYASQGAYVFQDTAYNNISMYDKNMKKERVLEACDAALFTEVIEKMPDGLDTVMAQNGKNISGGQRQRMSLARTVAKEADIYIFDDTFSALDAVTERASRQNINKMLKGKTVVIVAQKINTIKEADQIIVLDSGCIVGKGTHEELLANCETYQEIYATQCYVEKEEA